MVPKLIRLQGRRKVSENPGVSALFGGHNLPSLVEIGSTDLLKSGDTLINYLIFSLFL